MLEGRGDGPDVGDGEVEVEGLHEAGGTAGAHHLDAVGAGLRLEGHLVHVVGGGGLVGGLCDADGGVVGVWVDGGVRRWSGWLWLMVGGSIASGIGHAAAPVLGHRR